MESLLMWGCFRQNLLGTNETGFFESVSNIVV